MNSESIWTEIRLSLKQLPIVRTLLIILLSIAVVAGFAYAFSRVNGKPWPAALPIALYLLLRQFWNSSSQTATPQGIPSETKSKNASAYPAVDKIVRFLRRHDHFIRKVFSVVLGLAAAVGSMWLLISLIRWFWLHPLFR